MNSFLLFNNRLSLRYSIRCTFWAKESGQKLIFALPYTFSTADYLILDIFFTTIYILTILWVLLCCSWLKSLLWFLNYALKDVSTISTYILVPLFALFSTSDWYIIVIIRLDFATASFFSFSSRNHTQWF